jgi:hypothetical protein
METMFRYLAILPPKQLVQTDRLVSVDASDRSQSTFLRELQAAAGAVDESVAAARRYQATAPFKDPFATGFEPLPNMRALLADKRLDAADLVAEAGRIFKLGSENPVELLRAHLDSQEGRVTRLRLVEGILSLAYVPEPSPYLPDERVAALKTLELIQKAAGGRWPFSGPLTLDAALDRMTAVIPRDLAAVRVDRTDPAANDRPSPPQDTRLDHLNTRIARYAHALEELHHPTIMRHLEVVPRAPRASGSAILASRPPGSIFSRLFGSETSRRQPLATLESAPPSFAVRIAPDTFDDLGAGARETLGELGFTRDTTNLLAAQQALEAAMTKLQEQVHAAMPARYVALVGNLQIPLTGVKPNRTPPYIPTLGTGATLAVSSPFYAGQGELRVVRQELVAYELADIAHIENVLAGEERRRTHRRLDRTEEIERERIERTSETARDLQSTSRHELETESQQSAQTAVHVEGGVTVSGSYGPTVTFTANASAGFSHQTESSSRRASRFAQEVVDRSVERIKERTEQERTVTLVREIEEINRHYVLNARQDATHVRGVYRWLNKIYRAQIYTYGIRHMFEFNVPEPAAFYLWSLTQSAAATLAADLQPPMFDDTRLDTDWHRLALEYGASGVDSPPPRYVEVAHAAHNTEPGNAPHQNHTWSTKIKVPDGYEAFAAIYNVQRITGGYDAASTLQIYENQIHGIVEGVSGFVHLERNGQGDARVTGEVGIAFSAWGAYTYSVTVHLLCERTLGLLNKWRFDTFAAISEAYRDYETERQARLEQAKIGKGVTILGSNPAINQRTIREELQRCCLSMLTQSDFEHFDAFEQSQPNEARQWRINQPRARQHGREAQFLQNAFEWENMTYVFYPYFYGRAGQRWVEMLHQMNDDPDPQFSAFLRAGTARVQVPVRPGFESVVARYCQDPANPPWSGNDPPLIGDDLHVAIIDEIKRSLDAPDEGVPEGDPWEVRVPTSLVLLEDASNLAGFRDPLFGDQQGASRIRF